MQYLLQILLMNIFIKEECLKMSVIRGKWKKINATDNMSENNF